MTYDYYNEYLTTYQKENFNQSKQNQVDLESFILVSVIGKGSYGKVVLVKKKVIIT
jgi:hypothetical protein